MHRIAVYSDVHANLPALEAVLANIAASGIKERYCLGDTVGYGPYPLETMAKIQAIGDTVIQGNYDRAIGEHLGRCGTEYETPQETLDAAEAFAFTITTVTGERSLALAGLPTEIRLHPHDCEVLLCHASPRGLTDVIPATASASLIASLVADSGAGVICAGHTHHPFHRSVPRGRQTLHWINVGSVGRPDGRDARAVWTELVFGDQADVVRAAPGDPAAGPVGDTDVWLGAVIHRVEYDRESVYRAMVSIDMPAGLSAPFKRTFEGDPLADVELSHSAEDAQVPAATATGDSSGECGPPVSPEQQLHRCACALTDRVAMYEGIAAIFGGDAEEAAEALRTIRASIDGCRTSRYVDEPAIRRSLERADLALETAEGRAAFDAERDRLFGERSGFDPFTHVLSADELTYLWGDPEENIDTIRSVYDRVGFMPPPGDSVGHISTELRFMAHSLRSGRQGDPDAIAAAREFFIEHLSEWAVLFAVVTTKQAKEPAMLFAGMAFDKLLISESSVFRHAVPERCAACRSQV